MANDSPDPLTEPTREARLHAAMLAGGHTISTLARALGMRWQTVSDWFSGSVPSLEAFARACELLGYSMIDIFYGYERPGSARVLTQDEIKRLLRELGTGPELRAAFARHQDSPEGRYQDYSRAYITTWLTSFATALRLGNPQARALELANSEALRVHALADAVSAGVRFVDTSDLAAALSEPPPAAPVRRKRRPSSEVATAPARRPANAGRR